MTATIGSVFDTNRTAIQEVLNTNITTFMPQIDPFWRDMIASSQGVVPSDQLGRGYLIHKIFNHMFGGVIEPGWGPSQNDFGLFGDDNVTDLGDRMIRRNYARTFPDATEAVSPIPVRLTIPMRSMNTNMPVSMAELRAEATSSVLTEITAPRMEGFARNIVHRLTNAFYTSQNDSYRLAAISNVATSTGTGRSGGTVYRTKFYPTNKAVERFILGERVDVYDSTGATRRNEASGTRIRTYVELVDEIGDANGPFVVLVSEAALSGVTNGDIVVYANSKATSGFRGIAGYRSYMKFSTNSADSASLRYLLGDEAVGGGPEGAEDGKIDVVKYPEHRSYLKNINGVLTEQVLRRNLRAFHRAKDKYGQSIDFLVASDGVWLAYEAQKIGQYQIDRTNRLSSLNNEGSEEGFQIKYDGRSYTGYTSLFIESGVVLGHKKGGQNWKRIVPPDPAGAQSLGQVPAFAPFKFVANILAGHGSNRLPITDASGRLTEASQMPGVLCMQVMAEQPAGLLLTGCTEDRTYGDTAVSGSYVA
jgi:hypothetical protein